MRTVFLESPRAGTKFLDNNRIRNPILVRYAAFLAESSFYRTRNSVGTSKHKPFLHGAVRVICAHVPDTCTPNASMPSCIEKARISVRIEIHIFRHHRILSAEIVDSAASAVELDISVRSK